MLARKNSSGRGGGPTQFGARESIAAISDMLNTQQKKNARASKGLIKKKKINIFFINNEI